MTTTENKLKDLCEEMGVKMEAQRLGYQNKEDWECIAFHCQILKGGKEAWSGEYRMGLGCVKIPKHLPFILGLTATEENMIYTLQRKPHSKFKTEYQREVRSLYNKLSNHQNIIPKVEDVMYSILLDGSVFFDGQTFDDFCSEMGYSNDSIKAEKTWRACMDTGMQLRKVFKAEEIEKLREAAQET